MANEVSKFPLDNSLLNDSEKKYKLFCDKLHTTVIFLHQSPSSFSGEIKKYGGKRPDFFHITPMGEFYVDVKSSKLSKFPKFTLSLEDYNKLRVSQRILKKPILVAYPIDPWGGEDWGFISLSHLEKLKEQQITLIEKGYRWIGIHYSDLKKYVEIVQLLM